MAKGSANSFTEARRGQPGQDGAPGGIGEGRRRSGVQPIAIRLSITTQLHNQMVLYETMIVKVFVKISCDPADAHAWRASVGTFLRGLGRSEGAL